MILLEKKKLLQLDLGEISGWSQNIEFTNSYEICEVQWIQREGLVCRAP